MPYKTDVELNLNEPYGPRAQMDTSRSSNARAVALKAMGICFLLAALYHLALLLQANSRDQDSPIRHAVFIGLNVAVAIGFYRRPRFFFWAFVPLGLQQLHGHGRALVTAFAREHRMDWRSVVVLAIVLLAGWLLWLEYRHPVERQSQ